MSEPSNTANAMSQSLMIREVYCICYPQRDGLECLRGELAAVRKKFFTGNRKAVRAGKQGPQSAFDGKLSGKMTRRGLYWKKSSGELMLEEAFDQQNGYVIVKKDYRGVTVSRTFFDKDHLWLKSEYFEPWNASHAQVIFKPQPTADLIERFDWDSGKNRYQATDLHPLPYHSGAAEQSVLTAQFGDPTLILSTAEGEFCYCPKKEAQERLKAWENLKDGTIVLMPAWEVKDGALTGEEEAADTNLTFTSLEEYAKIEPGQPEEKLAPASQPAAPPLSTDTAEFTLPANDPSAAPEDAPAQPEKAEAGKAKASRTEDELILQAARDSFAAEQAAQEEQASEPDPGAEPVVKPVEPRQKKPAAALADAGTGVVAAYHGSYSDGKREGFGSYYYKDGTLCYAGGWKDDKKEGLGVSFRSSDHALHISNWENGKPGGMVTLFDKNGNLRYSGRMVDGKKQGAGVTVNQEDGTVFVGKWENGQPTGLGSSFDSSGNLLYYGSWKNGLRDGHGTEFDPAGGIVYDGEWKNGKYHNGILYQKLSAGAEEDAGDVFEETEL